MLNVHDTYDTADEMEIIDYNIQPPEDHVGDLPDLNDHNNDNMIIFKKYACCPNMSSSADRSLPVQVSSVSDPSLSEVVLPRTSFHL